MKYSTTYLSCLLAALTLVLATQQATAQKLIDVKKPILQTQKTPRYNPTGVKKKNWKPKTWIEFEVPFTALKAPEKGLKTIPELTVEFYVLVVVGKSKTLLSTTLNHRNIPLKEATASVVYISPSEIRALAGGASVSNPTKLVKEYGVEVKSGGTTVGFYDSTGKRNPEAAFWKAAEASTGVKTRDGALLPKKDTPFAPLWYDYHAETE